MSLTTRPLQCRDEFYLYLMVFQAVDLLHDLVYNIVSRLQQLFRLKVFVAITWI
jgi:hypothetical protein